MHETRVGDGRTRGGGGDGGGGEGGGGRGGGGKGRHLSVPVILLWILVFLMTRSVDCNRRVSDLVEELLSSTRYNSRTRPNADLGKPLDVYININVNDISSISEVRMDYSMTLYLRQVWTDDRLEFAKYNYDRYITLNHNQFDRLWTPDVFIRNLKAGIFHTITVPNRLIRLKPDGSVLYSQRLALTLACDMILDKYPMDSQQCYIEFGSYAYTREDLEFHWRSDAPAIEMNKDISLPEYTISNISHVVCTKNFSSTGDFPCLRAYIHLNRRLRAYILTTYLPSFLVVLLSWLSFWIDMESAPARTSLSILTVLTITTQSSGLLRSMPAGSFTKAIDVWMATCLVFVFGAFIEYSVVNTLARREKAKASAAAARKQLQQQQQEELQQLGQQVEDLDPGGGGGGCGALPPPPPPTSPGACRCPASSQERMSLTNGWNEENLTSALQLSVCVCRKTGSGKGSRATKKMMNADDLEEEEGNRKKKKKKTFWKGLCQNKAVMVEVISRALFPMLFLIFNLVYWPMYLF